MRKRDEPFPVKLYVALLTGDPALPDEVEPFLREDFGRIDYRSAPVPFDVTDYYEEELGRDLKRIFLSFADLIMPDRLAAVKRRTDEIEETFAVEGRRRVNIDPGYLDYHKVLLASNKYGGQKIYLTDGVWADPALHYTKGRFLPFEWTFPDFKEDRYGGIFMEIRARYKKTDRSKE